MKRFLLLVTVLLVALGTSQFPAKAQETSQKNYIVVLKSAQTDSASIHTLKEFGAEIIFEATQIGVVDISSDDPSILQKLEGNSKVLAVAEDVDIRTFDGEAEALNLQEAENAASVQPDLYEQYQWDIKRVTRNGESWNINQGNKKTLVAVIDTGVDFSHPDLKDNLVFGKAFFPGAVPGDELKDSGSHGTHVA